MIHRLLVTFILLFTFTFAEDNQKLGEALNEIGVKEAVFDRGGYIYHGRVQAVAEGIREKGIKF